MRELQPHLRVILPLPGSSGWESGSSGEGSFGSSGEGNQLDKSKWRERIQQWKASQQSQDLSNADSSTRQENVLAASPELLGRQEPHLQEEQQPRRQSSILKQGNSGQSVPMRRQGTSVTVMSPPSCEDFRKNDPRRHQDKHFSRVNKMEEFRPTKAEVDRRRSYVDKGLRSPSKRRRENDGSSCEIQQYYRVLLEDGTPEFTAIAERHRGTSLERRWDAAKGNHYVATEHIPAQAPLFIFGGELGDPDAFPAGHARWVKQLEYKHTYIDGYPYEADGTTLRLPSTHHGPLLSEPSDGRPSARFVDVVPHAFKRGALAGLLPPVKLVLAGANGLVPGQEVTVTYGVHSEARGVKHPHVVPATRRRSAEELVVVNSSSYGADSSAESARMVKLPKAPPPAPATSQPLDSYSAADSSDEEAKHIGARSGALKPAAKAAAEALDSSDEENAHLVKLPKAPPPAPATSQPSHGYSAADSSDEEAKRIGARSVALKPAAKAAAKGAGSSFRRSSLPLRHPLRQPASGPQSSDTEGAQQVAPAAEPNSCTALMAPNLSTALTVESRFTIPLHCPQCTKLMKWEPTAPPGSEDSFRCNGAACVVDEETGRGRFLQDGEGRYACTGCDKDLCEGCGARTVHQGRPADEGQHWEGNGPSLATNSPPLPSAATSAVAPPILLLAFVPTAASPAFAPTATSATIACANEPTPSLASTWSCSSIVSVDALPVRPFLGAQSEAVRDQLWCPAHDVVGAIGLRANLIQKLGDPACFVSSDVLQVLFAQLMNDHTFNGEARNTLQQSFVVSPDASHSLQTLLSDAASDMDIMSQSSAQRLFGERQYLRRRCLSLCTKACVVMPLFSKKHFTQLLFELPVDDESVACFGEHGTVYYLDTYAVDVDDPRTVPQAACNALCIWAQAMLDIATAEGVNGWHTGKCVNLRQARRKILKGVSGVQSSANLDCAIWVLVSDSTQEPPPPPSNYSPIPTHHPSISLPSSRNWPSVG